MKKKGFFPEDWQENKAMPLLPPDVADVSCLIMWYFVGHQYLLLDNVTLQHLLVSHTNLTHMQHASFMFCILYFLSSANWNTSCIWIQKQAWRMQPFWTTTREQLTGVSSKRTASSSCPYCLQLLIPCWPESKVCLLMEIRLTVNAQHLILSTYTHNQHWATNTYTLRSIYISTNNVSIMDIWSNMNVWANMNICKSLTTAKYFKAENDGAYQAVVVSTCDTEKYIVLLKTVILADSATGK